MRDFEATLTAPVTGVLRSWVAEIVFRPWFDDVSLRYIARGYMPVSRAWACALEGEAALTEALADAKPSLLHRLGIERVCREIDRLQRGFEAADADWQDGFFAPSAPDDDTLAALYQQWGQAAQRLMASRAYLLLARRHMAPVAWDIAAPAAVIERHRARLDDPGLAFPAPIGTRVDASRGVATTLGLESWLRFQSPAPHVADTAWAHVFSPSDEKDPPTLIYLHGIMMETDMWQGMADPITEIARRGVRVIRPEGPWHGRRRAAGFYGGEPIMARGPAGMLELFEAWVAEIGVLIDWARQTSAGPVAIGGVSLGALTSQLTASVAADWPERLRPDALLLLTTTGWVLDAVRQGALAEAVGAGPVLEAAGWRDEDIARLRTLLEPRDDVAVPGDRIIVVSGESDTVTPNEGSRILARRWGVPAENLYESRHGHFSTPLRLYRDAGPLDRLVELLEGKT